MTNKEDESRKSSFVFHHNKKKKSAIQFAMGVLILTLQEKYVLFFRTPLSAFASSSPLLVSCLFLTPPSLPLFYGSFKFVDPNDDCLIIISFFSLTHSLQSEGIEWKTTQRKRQEQEKGCMKERKWRWDSFFRPFLFTIEKRSPPPLPMSVSSTQLSQASSSLSHLICLTIDSRCIKNPCRRKVYERYRSSPWFVV